MKRHSHPIGNEGCTLWDAICSMKYSQPLESYAEKYYLENIKKKE